MKLDKPIVITITNPANAVELYLRLNTAIDLGNVRVRRIWDKSTSEVRNQLWGGFKANGIEPLTWEPPQPLHIAGCEADFKSNGDVRLGSETLDRATLEKVYAESNKAMGKVEEWPRYWKASAFDVMKAEGPEDLGTFFDKRNPVGSKSDSRPTAVVYAKDNDFTPLTRAEACTILGRDV